MCLKPYLPSIRFDIADFDFEIEDEPGMLRTVSSLNQLITAEVDAGIPSDRIILGGFSQGAAMTLLTGLTSERKLGGLIVLSGWLPLRNKIKAVGYTTTETVFSLTDTDPAVDVDRPRKETSYLLGSRSERPLSQVQMGPAI